MDILCEQLAFAQNLSEKLKPSISLGKKYLGVSIFGYRRFLEDGKSFGFSDSHQWNKTFLEKFAGFPIAEYCRELDQCLETGKLFMYRTGIPASNERYYSALYDQNIWNTFFVYKYNPVHKYVESYYFCSTRDNVQLIRACLNNTAFLNSWVGLLEEELSSLLCSMETDLFLPTIDSSIMAAKLSNSAFQQNGDQKNFFDLSERERELLHLISLKHARKEISILMGVSCKTVDSYLERIKKKTKTCSKHQLLMMLDQYGG